MLLRHDRTPAARPAGREPQRSPGVRRAVLVLVGAVVVGTGLGATGVGVPDASAEQASAQPVDLLGGGSSDAPATSAADARAAAEVSSRSAARDAAVDAEQLRRAEEAAQQEAADAAEAGRQRAAAQQEADRAAAAQAAAQADPRAIGRTMTAERGWGGDQFACLDSLWTKESDWTATADNPTSDAYGIPQSLPGEKMASAGADWATDPATQISWGLTYIRDVYGTPCSAWAHSRATDWY